MDEVSSHGSFFRLLPLLLLCWCCHVKCFLRNIPENLLKWLQSQFNEILLKKKTNQDKKSATIFFYQPPLPRCLQCFSGHLLKHLSFQLKQQTTLNLTQMFLDSRSDRWLKVHFREINLFHLLLFGSFCFLSNEYIQKLFSLNCSSSAMIFRKIDKMTKQLEESSETEVNKSKSHQKLNKYN